MKRTILLALCTILMIICGCKGKSSNTGQQSSDTEQVADSGNVIASATSDSLLPDSLFFMLQDQPLPRHVDLTQDISHLSYTCLRLLRSYVYATHGHWFMEGELNQFFQKHTQWYDTLCYNMWYDLPYDSTTQKARAYTNALWDDYASTYGMIELTDKEQAFIERIDLRMREMEQQKLVPSTEGVQLLNPELAVNWFQMFQPDSSFARRLRETNIALQPATYQQLFNVYEANDYYNIPNFVTTDVMLQAYHMYFSYILKYLESDIMIRSLRQALWQMLLECHTRMSTCPEMRLAQDMDNAVYCAVGLKLLGYDALERKEVEHLKEWMAGKPMYNYQRELELVEAAEDDLSPLFHTRTNFPYSLFKPRGHYTRNEASQRYFRAMMWLQKGCFKREDPDQLAQAISLASLINATPAAQKHLRSINQVLTFLMGTPDNVSLLDLATYMREQGLTGNEVFLDSKAVAQIDTWLKKEFKTHNRIRPKQQIELQDEMNLLPGRYSLDGEILSKLYDPAPDAPRAYPSGLDVMDILGVETATSILQERNRQQPWADYDKERKEQTERIRKFSGWNNTLYNKWMHTLVTLQKPDKQQPPFMQTRAWKLKNLNSSLASWALLKHDGILYCEQPIAAECGGGGLPDPEVPGYVEPNLPFWEEMENLLFITQQMLERNHLLTDMLRERGKTLSDMIAFCRQATEKELAGQSLTRDEYCQIKNIGSYLEWFTLSIIDPETVQGSWDEIKGADRYVAQVADVFSRNIVGCPKDGILYEAAGMPNDIYVVVEMKGHYYLTRGAVYSYYEFVRPLGDRLTDEQWQDMLIKGHGPAVPEWFAPMLMQGAPANPDERFVYSTGC